MTSMRALLVERRQARGLIDFSFPTKPVVSMAPARLLKKGVVVAVKPPDIPTRKTIVEVKRDCE